MSTPSSALTTIKSAVRAGRWLADPHLLKQIAKRGISLSDVIAAVTSARRIEPHDMRPLNEGGESWRVVGFDSDGRLLGIGVELVRDSKGSLVVIITAFIKESSK